MTWPPSSATTSDGSALLRDKLGQALNFHQRGQFGQAETAYRSALKLDPSCFEAMHGLGLLLHELRRCAESISIHTGAIAARPDFAGVYNNRALVFRDVGRLDDALADCEQAIALNPEFSEAFYNRGLILRDLKRLEAALASFDRANALGINTAELFCDRGGVLRELGRLGQAIASFDRAIALQPDCYRAFNDRGLAFHELDRLDAALADLDRALFLKPDFTEAHNNRGNVTRDLGRAEEAVESYDRAIGFRPDYAEALTNRGQCRLSLGRMDDGWADYEHRCKVPLSEICRRADIVPERLLLWPTRSDVRDRRVLVVAEQGVGDELMFAGMVNDLAQDARTVTLECNPRLASLFARSFPNAAILPRKTPADWNAENYDCLLPAGSLGHLYRRSLAEFPERERYLMVNPAAAACWKDSLAGLGTGLKVGISWRGGTPSTNAHRRSTSLALWRPILEQTGVHFVSLQYGDAEREIAAAGMLFPGAITRLASREIDDFDQLAGLVSALDLVVTVQTALVHLCGATGQRCLVMVPYAAEWRYGTKGSSMPWYRSVELFRQEAAGRWREPIGGIAAQLKYLIQRGRQCRDGFSD
jgi:tetratricopeptide (TPR) repeat protein